ncbi:hypothetical protein K1719_043225 [Acacia pycnantha]|nr:hypothetical protein K1719_043225 [Acacia pycnantha]
MASHPIVLGTQDLEVEWWHLIEEVPPLLDWWHFKLIVLDCASKAVEILEAYEGTLEDDHPPENERCEHGEMLLYKISLLEKSGLLERALEELHKKESKIVC